MKTGTTFLLIAVFCAIIPLTGLGATRESTRVEIPDISWPREDLSALTHTHKNASGDEKNAQKRLFVINLHIPTGTKVAGLCAYYKGQPLKLSNALCTLPEHENRLTFSYVITEEVLLKSCGNTVQCLQRKPGVPCLWYDLTLRIENDDKDEPTYDWTIDEKEERDMPRSLPDHAILIQTNPALVAKICTTQSAPLESEIVYLPTIFLVEGANFSQKSVYATMASIDMRTVHTEETKAIHIPNERTSITLPLSLRACCNERLSH